MKVDLLLDKLQKVKRTGPQTWLCCCPAHDDKHPSMTVRECEDGRILCHCFSGCDVGSILDSVGLSWDALFPDKPIEYAPAMRRPFPAGDVLEACADECQFVAYCAAFLRSDGRLSTEDHSRLFKASERILEARRMALG